MQDNSSIPNIHCKLADRISIDENGVDQSHNVHSKNQKNDKTTKFYVIKVEYFAYKEKLLREELKLINEHNSVELLKLVLTSRVLGKGKGTPMLRNGIHCIGFDPDEESEMSEDQSNPLPASRPKTSQ